MKRKRTTGGRPNDPASINYARIVYELLTDPRGWRVSDLKSELGISDWTYRHYRQRLSERFVQFSNRQTGESLIEEIGTGEGRRLRLKAPPEDSERVYAQVVALYLASQLFEFLKDTSLGNTVADMFSEIRRHQASACALRHVLDNFGRLFYYLPFGAKDYKKHGQTIDKIIRALINQQKLRLTYKPNVDAAAQEHIVEPLTMVLYLGGLYLILQYPGVKKQYQFAIDRITQIEVLREGFTYPPKNVYKPSSVFEDTFGSFFEPKGELTDFEVIFAAKPWLKQYVRERTWHRSQRFEDLPDGRLRMRFRVRGRLAPTRWIHYFGNDVEVVSPAGLLDEGRDAASA